MSADPQSRYSLLLSGPQDAAGLVACLDKAFAGDYLIQSWFPKDKAHLTPPEELMRWRVGRAAERMGGENAIYYKVVLTDEPEVMVGYAGWMKPGHFGTKGRPSTQESHGTMGSDSAEQKDESFPACADPEVFKVSAQRFDEARKEIWGDDPDYWYLSGLGVDPVHQRQGLASTLLKFGLDAADKDEVPIYLEASEAGARIYPRYGFETIRTLQLLDGRNISQVMIRQPTTRA